MTTKHRAFNTNIIIRELPEQEIDVKSQGGIILNSIQHSLERDMSRSEGIIEDIGANAFDDFGDVKPQVGARVVFARYAGKELGIYQDGFKRRIMRDLDVLCEVVEEENNQ